MSGESSTPSRRATLALAAAAAGWAFTGCTRTFFLDAGTPSDVNSTDGATPDVDEYAADPTQILNSLLATEFRLIAAYDDATRHIASAPATDPLASMASTWTDLLIHFQNHHRDHASLLTGAIQILGGNPIRSDAVQFLPPDPFNPTITNVLKLASNNEKTSAILHGQSIVWLHTGALRAIPASILGAESQHFAVLSSVIRNVVQPGEAFGTMVQRVVPAAVVTTLVGIRGLESVPDYLYP